MDYIPGAAAGLDIKGQPIHIGLFGVMAVGKSAFINSLSIALKGNYFIQYFFTVYILYVDNKLRIICNNLTNSMTLLASILILIVI